VSGTATLIHPATLPWDRTFRAEYLGDFRFHGSFSPLVPQMTYIPSVAVDPAAVRPTLSLAPARQPSRAGEFALRFTLATSEPAALTVFDIRGRALHSRSVGDFGPGAHLTTLEANLRPGIYLVRLEQGGRTARARAVVLE
jgi:hypothetical protein